MLPVPGFTSTGPGGGPFSVTMESFLLTNTGPALLNWSLGNDSAWLSASPTNGTLNSGGTAAVVVSLNSAASLLLAGDHAAHLTVTNLSNGLLHHRTFNLDISDPLTLSPASGIEFGGPPSGPFNSAAMTCWLTNASQVSVNFSLVTNPPWLGVSPTSGILGPHGTTPVTCSLNSAATNLPAGAYYADILFTNLTFGAEETLPVSLLVGQLIQNGGYETGNLACWTLTGSSSMTSVATNSTVVHSGAYGLGLTTPGAWVYLSQSLPTVPGQLYSVSLWLNNSELTAPNGFTLSWAGNTVANYTNLPAVGWTNLQFILSATDTNTVLQIGLLNYYSYVGLDDISVRAAPPTIGSVSPASGPAGGGALVTIAGTGFQSHATVAFGSVAAASVAFNGTTNLTAITPPSAVGAVNVTITNADGQTAVLTNGFVFVGTPAITWTNPPPITYGNALDASRLNATANVPGTFVYIPPSRAVLNSGSNTLSLLFTPNDTVDYYSATDSVQLVVWRSPLSVTAGDVTRQYGITNPVFTGAIVGLQNGDNIAAVYYCSATSASSAGTYPIVPSLTDPGNRLPNYDVSLFNGTLTVLPPVPPVFQRVALLSSNIVMFNWAATVGDAYQVQYNPNLTTTNWTNLGNPIVATNAIITATNSITDLQRFYRVLLAPQ
jgi:hypothetical protein